MGKLKELICESKGENNPNLYYQDNMVEYLSYIANYLTSDHIKGKKHIKKLKKELHKYISIMQSLEQDTVYDHNLILSDERYDYIYEYTLSDGCGNLLCSAEMVLCWEIDKIFNTIKNNEIKKMEYTYPVIKSTVDESFLNSELHQNKEEIIQFNYSNGNNRKEICIMNIAPLGLNVVIDGNHKLCEQSLIYESDEKASKVNNNLIPVYYLNSDMFINSLSNNKYQITYKIMSNLQIIQNYIFENNMNKTDLSRLYKIKK